MKRYNKIIFIASALLLVLSTAFFGYWLFYGTNATPAMPTTLNTEDSLVADEFPAPIQVEEQTVSAVVEVVPVTPNTPTVAQPFVPIAKEPSQQLPQVVSPLILSESAVPGALTRSGIIAHTNKARMDNGLAPLKEQQLLHAIAAIKAQDMIDRQYFAHESPTGDQVNDLADDVGYTYIIVGENLALGDFESDAQLVDGWMNSPGHRANILKSRYTEIGVAAIRGIYEGRDTWVSVQVFALPRVACPQPDASLKQTIIAKQTQYASIGAELKADTAYLDAALASDPAYDARYAAYLSRIASYNALGSEINELVSAYNKDIQAFNACIKN